MSPIFNFGAGPAMMPEPVMQRVQKEWRNFQDLGISVIELSHRSKEFVALVEQCTQNLRTLLQIPQPFHVLYMHGGAQMQFAAVPLNLMNGKPSQTATFIDSGIWSKKAFQEAKRYGQSEILASSEGQKYDRVPEVNDLLFDHGSYVHLTSNNTLYGTQWKKLPNTGELPLVIDATSDLLSQPIDFSKVGLVFAGVQKNVGPAGLAIVIIREDLLGHALPQTPPLLNYEACLAQNSLLNTPNTFAIYMVHCTLEWMLAEGGVPAFEKRNQEKAAVLYDVLDQSSFYQGLSHPEHRSVMNVTFDLPTPELLTQFLQEADQAGLYALKGHRLVGGARASIYNAMPLEGVQKLASFMKAFEKAHKL